MNDRDRNLILIVLAAIAVIAYIGWAICDQRGLRRQTDVVREQNTILRSYYGLRNNQ